MNRYSNLWTKSRADCKMYLRYNHRSNAKLIELFNKFSKRYFTTLHHTQLVGATGSTNSESKQTEKQDSKEEQKSLIPFLTETETKSVSSTSPIPASMDSSADAEHDAIVNVTETKNSQTETPDEKKGNSGVSLIIVPRERMGDALAVELMKHKPKDVYVIAPISVEKYNMGQIMLEARNRLVRSRCKYPLYTLTEYAKYNPQDNVYFAGSSMKLKGMYLPCKSYFNFVDRYGKENSHYGWLRNSLRRLWHQRRKAAQILLCVYVTSD